MDLSVIKDTDDGAFRRGISPWFVVAWKDAHVTTTHELFII